MARNRKVAPATQLAQANHFIDPQTGGVVPPVHLSTTYARDEGYDLPGGYSYTRTGTPAWDQVETLLADLEGGAAAMVFGSGLAAATAVFESLVAGQHVVAPKVMYHGLQDWLRTLVERRGIELTLVDAADTQAVADAVIPGKTAIVWIEALLNPTFDVIDIAACARIAHQAGARLGVDATVTPPVTTKALSHGADLVFHSTTKYLNGHSDVMGGALITAALDTAWSEIVKVRNAVGGIMAPFDAWLLLRGMRTLSIRFERASANALAIARHFDGHPHIDHVLYPGLPSHPGHAIAQRQMTGGFGGMLSLRIKGGEDPARLVATGTEVFLPATSLGGVESLLEHRFVVEGPHSAVPRDLLRLSVGIEDEADLIDDLEQALGRL